MYKYSESIYADGKEIVFTVQNTPYPKREWDGTYFTHRIHDSKWDSTYESYFFVLSAGHEFACPLLTHGPKVLDRFVIHYVVDGKGTFNGNPFHAGQFFFTHPFGEHTIIADVEDPFEYYYIGATGPGTKELMKRVGFCDIPEIYDFNFADKLPALFDKVLYTAQDESDMELFLLSVFYRLMGWHKKEFCDAPDQQIKRDAHRYYHDALFYIDQRLEKGETVSPGDIAEHLHISQSYLRKLFSRYCKYSMRELLLRKRINAAASYMLFEDHPVTNAASMIGYDDYTQFSRIFKKYTGVSPSVYKKQGLRIEILPDNLDNEDTPL